MTAYLGIVAGAIKLFNYLAASLQQHHDEMNGVNAERLANVEVTMEELKTLATPVSVAHRDELWDRNRAKFGPDRGKTGN